VEAATVNITVLALVVLAGLNAAVTPVGKPETARLTLPLNPFWPLTLMVLLPLPLWETVRLAGMAERLKPGATTVRLIVAVLLRLPEVPLIVSG
jgi:hypothetical protein